MKLKNSYKFFIGMLFGFIFMFIAFRNVNFKQMFYVIKTINFYYVILAFLMLLFNTYFRSLRWGYLLIPIKKIDNKSLFISLIIGHAGNIIFPAYLGEFLRVYVLGKKTKISASSALATVVTERILDILFLLIIMSMTFFVFPFPSWSKNAGFVMLVATILLILFIFSLKTKNSRALNILQHIINLLPSKFHFKMTNIITSFLDGFVLLKSRRHYVNTIMISLLIWATHILSFVFCFFAFDLYLPWIAPFVLVIMTTISVAFPITPGYVGSYHLLCQISLGLFGIVKSIGLSYALITHGLNTIPFLGLGLILAWYEGINITEMSKKNK